MRAFLRFTGAPVTFGLLVLIFGAYIVEWFSGINVPTSDLARTQILYDLGGITSTLFQDHAYWRALAAMFLHVNVLHLATNTFSLWQLGTLYEQMFGSRRLFLTYFATGLLGSFASAKMLPANAVGVGASGAIFGILGSFIFSILLSPHWRREKFLFGQLVFWAVANLLLPYYVPNIDQSAHIAGLVSGLILGLYPTRVPPPPPGQELIDVAPHSMGGE